MDSIFLLGKIERSQFLQTLAKEFRCTYICLWSYHSISSNDLSSHLLSIDGWYNEENHHQPSSSSGSLGKRLFDAYRGTLCSIENGYVPGLACKESIPYLELTEVELMRRASAETQRQFYQEARIKIAVFLGCKLGEIEIGSPTPSPVNMEMGMRNWFPGDFLHRQYSLQFRELPPPPDQNWPSSSSSSLRSLSVGSPDQYSPLLFNMPGTSYMTTESLKEAQIEQAIRPTSTTLPLHQQTSIEAYHRLLGIFFLNPESDDAAMTRAMLAVMSSPSSSSSSYQPQPMVPQERSSAFRQYTMLSPARNNVQIKAIPPRQNMMKRAFALLRSMNLRRIQEQSAAAALRSRPPPTTSQLQHKISERKRREKLNESFEELRLLLPPGSKKDKASVLKNTREYLNKLSSDISDLKKKNQQLETRISCARGSSTSSTEEAGGGSPSRRIDVQIGRASESTSEEQEVELRVTVRGDCDTVALVICILESLKEVENANLVSMEANTELRQQQGSTSINRVILQLKIKGEWDESVFKEAITRAVSDLAQ